MNNAIKRRTCVYVVRIWAEYLNEQPPCWRGVIEGCEPGETTPFTSLEEMNEIIQQKTYEGYQSGKQTGNKRHLREEL